MALLPVWEACNRKMRPGKKTDYRYLQKKYGATSFRVHLCRRWSAEEYTAKHREIMECRIYVIRRFRPDYGIPPMNVDVANKLQSFLYTKVKVRGACSRSCNPFNHGTQAAIQLCCRMTAAAVRKVLQQCKEHMSHMRQGQGQADCSCP